MGTLIKQDLSLLLLTLPLPR